MDSVTEQSSKLKVVTILGTRPEIIRLAAIIKKLDKLAVIANRPDPLVDELFDLVWGCAS